MGLWAARDWCAVAPEVRAVERLEGATVHDVLQHAVKSAPPSFRWRCRALMPGLAGPRRPADSAADRRVLGERSEEVDASLAMVRTFDLRLVQKIAAILAARLAVCWARRRHRMSSRRKPWVVLERISGLSSEAALGVVI